MPDLDPDLWLLRTDALMFVQAAMNCSELEAENSLLNYAAYRSPLAWLHQRWHSITSPQDGNERLTDSGARYRFHAALPGWQRAQEAPPAPTSPTPKRTPIPDREEIDIAVRTRFWRAVRNGLGRADGNSATYSGPLFLAPAHLDVRSKSKPERPVLLRNGILVDTWWWIEIRLTAIRFLAAPLIEAIRVDGGLVDVAIKHLQDRGRLPTPALSSSEPRPTPAERSGTLESQYAEALQKECEGSLRGMSKTDWARKMAELHGWELRSAQNWLSSTAGKELWRERSEAPPERRNKRRV